jgi:hypothetical protein
MKTMLGRPADLACWALFARHAVWPTNEAAAPATSPFLRNSLRDKLFIIFLLSIHDV